MKRRRKSRPAANLLALLSPMLSYGELVLRPVTIAERKSAAIQRDTNHKK
jgi:hypothetical protein